ncbi:MAG: PAS domain S-box protein [Oligoflexia bacterium]|nr:PAS domain S-box protein [Oligoflexia bacterium]
MISDETQELRDLQARLYHLQTTNDILVERTEALVLLGHTRLAFEQADGLEDALDGVNEAACTLLGVHGMCVALLGRDGATAQRSHCGATTRCRVLQALGTDPTLSRPTAAQVLDQHSVIGMCSLSPQSTVLVPFVRPTIGAGLLLFHAQRPATEMTSSSHHLEELGALLADQIEARALADALRRAHDSLEAQVDGRTADLRHQRARLQAVLHSAADGIVELTVDGVILSANAAFESMLGSPPGGLVGTAWRDLIHPEDVGICTQDLDRLRRGDHNIHTRDLRYLSTDGNPVDAQVRLSAVHDAQGAAASIVAVVRDLTDRLALEAQLRQSQKLEAIGQLAGGIAHDFNNLLMPILVDGQMLADALAKEDPRHEMAEEIVAAGQRAKELTRQLLAFGRKQMLDIRPVDLARLLAGFSRVLTRVLREDLLLNIEPCTQPAPTRADAGQLEQILMNLAINAQDAMPRGGKLTIRVLPTTQGPPDVAGDAWVAFEVEDTGTGMDNATQQRAIEPFFTTKARGKGTGLGLATCHGIARQHGGGLTIFSQPGQGTRVRVTLPADRAALAGTTGGQQTRDATHTAQVAGRLRGLQIWLVEDDDTVARSTLRILSQAGATVTAFPAAAPLLAGRAELPTPDLLLTDVIMPGMDGHKLHQTLRLGLPDLPVLYISGYPDDVLEPHGVRAPSGRFLQKPFSATGLINAITKALGSRPG